ncbi:Squalene epoxidase, partial [Irineochytrium annulatum]
MTDDLHLTSAVSTPGSSVDGCDDLVRQDSAIFDLPTLQDPTTDVGDFEPEVIVVGAGVAGSALATALASDGRRVALIERDWKEPDRIVGELLQPGGVKALQLLGIEGTLLFNCVFSGIDAIRVDGYAVFQTAQTVHLPYPKREDAPPTGSSFHHGRFIMRLREKARGCKSVRPIEGTVSSLISDPVTNRVLGVTYTSKVDGVSKEREIYAPLTIVVDGCFSKFRKLYITKEVESKSNFVGFVLTDCKLPFPNHGHVILADPSPILLYQIGTHDTRILVDIPGKLPSQANGDLKAYMKSFVGPQLPESIRPSFFSALDTERMRVMPNSFLPPTTNKQEGLIMMGDAMNMRHPLTGGGMTVALWDVVHVRNLLSQTSVPDYTDSRLIVRQMRTLHWRRKNLSSVVNILAQALYALFSAGD